MNTEERSDTLVRVTDRMDVIGARLRAAGIDPDDLEGIAANTRTAGLESENGHRYIQSSRGELLPVATLGGRSLYSRKAALEFRARREAARKAQDQT